MKRSMIAGAALAAGIAFAAPMLAWSADDEVQMTQAAPGEPGMGGMRGMMGRDRDGMMGRGGWMQPPRQRCEERLARRAGMVAYIVAKLNLTPEQRPLWDKLQAVQQAAADRERQLCAALKPPGERGMETILDRIGRREQFLTARLQGLHDTRPALEQLYQALTPEQKAIVDRPFGRRWGPK
jgi:LTXXQ motif family protein